MPPPYDPLLRQVRRGPNSSFPGGPPTGPAGGDLSGTYPNPTVARINGNSLGNTTPTAGNLLVGSGTQWVSRAMSGDATINSTGVLTLATVNANVGTFGDATHVAQVTLDAKGRVTAAANVLITGSSSSAGAMGPPGLDGEDGVDGMPGPPGPQGATGAAGSSSPGTPGPPGVDGEDGEPAFNGLTLNPTGVVAGMYGTSTDVGRFTVNATGQITSASNVPISNSAVPDFDPNQIIGVAEYVWDAASTLSPTTMNMSAVTGTGAGAGVTTNHSAQGSYNLYQSGNTVTNLAGWTQLSAASTQLQLQDQPVFRMKIWTGSAITSQRLWAGFTTMISAANLATDTPGASGFHAAMFRYSTVPGTPDTTFKAVTSNAVGDTITDTGITVVASTRYRLRIDVADTANIKFYINDVLVATNSATLPSTTTGMSLVSVTSTTTLNTQRQLGVAKWHIRQQQT